MRTVHQLTLLRFSILLLTLRSVLQTTFGHVQLVDPLPRGQLRGTRVKSIRPVDRDAPNDPKVFFPAGNKSPLRGSGHRSQKHAVKSWKEFKPLETSFQAQWRTGVCGDVKGRYPMDHLRGGKYYYGGKIVKTYIAGSVINFKLSMNANHNGFFQFHICNLKKCGGVLSPKCFTTKGACKELKRASNTVCDSGTSRMCGPIDRKNPGRWYVPCPLNVGVYPNKIYGALDNYGMRGEVKYHLPSKFVCSHCVLHFFYTSASNCNPPGVKEYFEGPKRPLWGRCPGANSAVGQYADTGLCGGRNFPEEYMNCADVRVVPKSGKKQSPIDKIELGEIVRGRFKAIAELSEELKVVKISYRYHTIKISLKWPVKNVFATLKIGSDVIISKRLPSVEPIYLFGDADRKPIPWKSALLEARVQLTVNTGGLKNIVRFVLA